MRKIYRRLIAGVFAALMLVTLFPFQVFAVDPVSAATMANALAQAITAYGASNGVSMMYDVTSTDGIGKVMHDLWGQFKADIQDNNVPTYDSLAVTLWTNLYTKVRNSVAVNVSAENVGYFDRFWNWLLSGPAQMQKVDNQYFEWTLTQNNTVNPITVITDAPYPSFTIGDTYRFNYSENSQNRYYDIVINSATDRCYYFFTTTDYALNIVSTASFSGQMSLKYTNGTQYSSSAVTGNPYTSPYNNLYRFADYLYANTDGVPYFPTRDAGMAAINAYLQDPYEDVIKVQPYVGDTVPQNVPIPDTDDPDYAPLPYVGPLGVSWIDNNFGDGQSLTDAQREAIAGALDNAIDDDGTLTLEEDQTVPDNPGGEVISGPSAYTVPGLADVFPFCIPFDIYHFLQALAADPTPPHFTAQLAFPEAIGGTQEIDIDFDSPTWNQLAQLLRLLELLLFIIGLAFVTRSMFIRG